MPKISLVMTVYNQKYFVKRCIESVVLQIDQDFELIIIDDGSIDGSGEICRKYASLYKNVNYFYISNSGVSAARNYGINKSLGEFIGFIDGDDYIEADYVLEMKKNIIDDSINMVCFGVNKIFAESGKLVRCKPSRYFNLLIQNSNIRNCGGNKIFRRSIINKYNIQFPIKSSFAEDYAFIVMFYVVGGIPSESIKINQHHLYNYWRHKSSKMSNIHKNLFSTINSCMENIEHLIEFFKKNHLVKHGIFNNIVINHFLYTLPIGVIGKKILKNKFSKREINDAINFYQSKLAKYGSSCRVINKVLIFKIKLLVYIFSLISFGIK
ncbi:MAG: glycosyltransferase family 2 protein [Burkholderiales bacterium]|nr:glycosyltransferase family 2 protein [Burkholderiales bacterium]